MKIKLCTLDNIPLFDHEGLLVTPSWREHETDDLGPKGLAALKAYTGQIVQIHPEDAPELVKLGLMLEGGKLVDYVAPVKPAKPAKAEAK